MTYEDLQNNLAITFSDPKFLRQAFVHRSYLNESHEYRESNERLEFLGDAVLSCLTSHFLFVSYPDFPEGVLTNIRSTLVKTQSLAQTGLTIGLGELLMLSRGEESSGGRKNPSLIADCYEALLGAIYLDQGLEAARSFLEKTLFPKTETIVAQKQYVDFKSLLQEKVQEKTKISPTYKVTKSQGPDHDKTFWVDVISEETILGSGSGKSKQEAEQDAAANALEKLGILTV